MGKVKDKLLELEEEGIIEWSDGYAWYYLKTDPEDVPFSLSTYLSTVDKKEPE